MELAYLVYIIFLINSMSILAFILFIISTAAFIVYVWGLLNDYGWGLDRSTKSHRKIVKTLFTAVSITALASVVLPDKPTMYTMLAAFSVQSVTSSETAQRIAPKSIEAIEKYLDKYLEEDTNG